MQFTTPIIGLAGRANAGKDTVADMAIEILAEKSITVVKIACADPLKRVCTEIFGTGFDIPACHFYGSQAEKEASLAEYGIAGWTGRSILQHIGTEGFRFVHPHIWPRLMVAQARKYLDSDDADVVFVSDVRFESESNAIQQAGGLVVRIKRPEADNKVAIHASEIDVDLISPDFIIDNQGKELYTLRNLVKDFLCQLPF